jgi:hypothetical protein
MSQPESNDNLKWESLGSVPNLPLAQASERSWLMEKGSGWLSAGLLDRLSDEIEADLERLEVVYEQYVTANSRLGNLRKGRSSQS